YSQWFQRRTCAEATSDDWLGRCHLRRPELALRNSRVAEDCFHSWLHDRRHGPHVNRSRISSPLHASCSSTWHGQWHRGTRCRRCHYTL
ncbi:unnamed protein product, partial [Aureobasidium uvarum]